MVSPRLSYARSVASLAAIADRADTRAIDVRRHGAIGGGLGTTIAAAGGDLAAIRSDTGQEWLQSTDSMDLAAFYLAQAEAEAEATGRGIIFPRDHYIFTTVGFVHSNIHIDLDGSVIECTTPGSAAPFVRGNRVFLLGILAREDFDRFAAQGWEQTANNLDQGATTLTLTSGTAPAVGDVLLIRTTAQSGSPTLPSYTTFNEVAAVAGMTVTLRYPLEKAITEPKVINYSTITTLKSALVGGGEPHRYYCCAHSTIRNGTLRTVDGGGFEFNGALDCTIDVTLDTPRGQAVYGNALNRSHVRARGVVGGPKNFLEFGVGAALSTVDVDIAYSGDSTDTLGTAAGSYNVIQVGEYTYGTRIRGKINAGTWPGEYGVTFPQAEGNTVDVDMVALGITQAGVSFAGTASVLRNIVRGRIEVGAAAERYALWSSGGGGANVVDGVTFLGTPKQTASILFGGPNLGAALDIDAPQGFLQFAAGASGNRATGYVRQGLTSAGPQGSDVRIRTEAGSFPPTDRIIAATASAAIANREAWGASYTNAGATAAIALALPTAEAGMVVRGYRDASFQLKLRPQATETVGTGAAGKAIQLDSDKAYVELRCYVAGHWVVAQSSGTLTYEP